LIDAGIPLVDYVSACTASLVADIPLVDVSSLEATTGGPELTVAAHPKFVHFCICVFGI
jgi:exosome complex component RRP41